jgi:hypothetical protein
MNANRILNNFVFSAVVAMASSAFAAEAPRTDLESGFRNPPTEYRARVWWDWLNGSVDKKAIRADLEDMKRTGIGGLQLRFINPKFPAGPVRFGTDAYYDALKYTIDTCGELGLDFGMHNTPGWSGSGGPFVPVEDAMKKIAWSEVPDVSGHVKVKLPQPTTHFNFYRDVAVLAVPADPVDDVKPQLTSDNTDGDVALLGDGKITAESAIKYPKTLESLTVTFTYPKPVQRRLLTITANFQRAAKLSFDSVIESSDDGMTFKPVRKCAFPGNLQAHNGFIGADQVLTAPFEPVTAKVFRVTIKGTILAPLAEVRFSDDYRIENYNTKIVTAILGGLTPPAGAKRDDPDAIPLDKVIDVTSSLSADGTLDWTAPAGRWAILRIGYTTTGIPNHPVPPDAEGFEVDKMDAGAVTRCFDHSLGRVLKENAGQIGKGFTNVFSDSWEAGQQNWCADFPKQFNERRGYDLRQFLPVVSGRVVGSLAESEGFLVDFRRTIGDLIAENYHGQMSRLAKQNGLHYYAEAYGGKAMAEIRSTMASERNMAEFWWRPDRSALSTAGVKKVASMAHALNRNIVAAEGFTTIAQDASYQGNPYLLKAVGDLAFTSGLTQLYFHTYAHTPFDGVAPGLSMGSTGTSVGRLVTWWPKSGAWLDYLGRCQFMLRQGRAVSDVLYFRMGNIGSFVSEKYPTMPDGLDYDMADDTYLMQSTVEKGVLRLPSGASYGVLVLPGEWFGDAAFLARLESFVAAGLTVVGPPPGFPGGLAEVRKADEVQAVVSRLWPKDKSKAKIRPQIDFAKVLAKRKVEPDLTLTGAAEDQVNYIHRRTDDGTDLYYIANKLETPVALKADFRVSGRQPELWDPVAGTITPISVFEAKGERTLIDLPLGDTGSAFVVFRRPAPQTFATAITTAAGKAAAVGAEITFDERGALLSQSGGAYRVRTNDGKEHAVEVAQPSAAIAIASPWSVAFQPIFRDAFTRKYDKLQSWSDADDETLKYFSGTGTYRTTVNVSQGVLKENQRAVLDLGAVHDVANVRVNGKPASTRWMPPFAVDVTQLVKAGDNLIEVDVTNRWVNRLMGDAKYAQDIVYQNKPMKKPSWGIIESYPDWLSDPAKIKSRQRSTFMSYATSYKPEDKLPASGLVGPVQIRFETVTPLPTK